MVFLRITGSRSAQRFVRVACFAAFVLACGVSRGNNVVRIFTTQGNILVRLYDGATPLHAANFLGYTNSGRYDNTFIHRSATVSEDGEEVPFVVQGGGFQLNNSIFSATNIVNASDPTVPNEPGISNLRGTLALAKTSAGPSTGTSQWFFNVRDNDGGPAFLDTQNGGFTVFGRAFEFDLPVIDTIAALDTISAGGAFTDVPVVDLNKVVSQQDILDEDAVIVTRVRQLNIHRADYNFNGVVDAGDYLVWRNRYGTTNPQADGNGDGFVDGADYALWRNSLGQSGLQPSGAGSGLIVLEPSALAVLLSAGGLLATRRRR